MAQGGGWVSTDVDGDEVRASRPPVDLHHHGDEELDSRAGDGQLDLAVNVRLAHPPAWLRARLEAVLAGLAAYPRPEAARAAVAARHRRDPAQVLLTNGAAEAFTLLARGLRPHRAVCVHPSFTAPEAALRAAGHPVDRVLLPPPFNLDPHLVPAGADLVVLGNPTNPTARLHPVETLERLARPGRTLVVDEAFADAVPGEPATLAARQDLPGLVVVRSLTKTWGLAGLRVGYLLGHPDLVARLARAQPPWPVNSLALEALVACSQPDAVLWAQEQARRTAGWRASLAAGLDRLSGVTVVPGGEAPFLLIQVRDATLVRARLRGLGIAVRRGDTFPGLGADWLRIAVAGPEHHDRILDGFARSLTGAWPVPAPAALPASPATPPNGRVTLVGAGPGGADLITLRGWRSLHTADVVVTDRLADPELTAQLRPGVKLVDAGKLPGAHQLSQEAIIETVLAHARAGRHVVRLKGGDPFVFGRGGEEVLACARAGIPCSVVPGLSSVTSAPALAGIPLTHRGLTQSFTVVSGHLPPGHPDSTVDWPSLARSTETLVLLMAVGNLQRIATFLLDGGRRPGTPVACVQYAGTPRQQVTSCPLADLAVSEVSRRIHSPAVVVIGPTVPVLLSDGGDRPSSRPGTTGWWTASSVP
jgi:histidinol-phosphate aminotransferase